MTIPTTARVLPASLKEFESIDSVGIAKRFRSKEATIVVIEYQRLDAATILFVSPFGAAWRYLDIGESRGTTWFERTVRDIENGGLEEELKMSGIRRRSLANGLVDLLDRDEALHPANFLGSCFRAIDVPRSSANETVSRAIDWISQLGGEAIVEVDDAYTSDSGWGVITTKLLSKPDHDLFSSLWTPLKFIDWNAVGGRAERILHLIARIESEGEGAIRVDAEFAPAVDLPAIDRRNLRNHQSAAKWKDLVRGSGGDSDTICLENLDLLFSAYARLANVLDWPRLFPSARRIALQEKAALASMPLSKGLPVDPFAELDEFLARMRTRYPVLAAPDLTFL